MGGLSLKFSRIINSVFDRLGLGMMAKLISIFLLVKVIPLILLAIIAWRQFTIQGDELKEIAVNDSSVALNDSAVENIERMSTDTARMVAAFLYGRDDDLRYLASLPPSEELYRDFIQQRTGRLIKKGLWTLDPEGRQWLTAGNEPPLVDKSDSHSTNVENNDMDGFRYRPPDNFEYEDVPLYDEITFVDLEGNELIKVVAEGSTKTNHPLSPEKKNVARRENTYIRAETYFEELRQIAPGEIAVSDVIGAYVGTNFIGLYTPSKVAEASESRGYDIEYQPEAQAYAGEENPNGRRFEGIVRWGVAVTDAQGRVTGYLTMALNHDHIMEFVDHLTPMYERYTRLPSADEGNYAFIWDYLGRSICHPRHHSIVGFNPETGDPQIPWLESTVYDGWKASGLEKWYEYALGYPWYFEQSRSKKPAPDLTRAGLVGLDCRWLNNAPQCTGWLDLTGEGGSGSFYILWSGLYKLNTAAAIPYYTGHYAPSEANNWSRRGFGFVAIGSGLEFFTSPAQATEEKLSAAVKENLSGTFMQLSTTTIILIVLVVFIAIWMASFITNSITHLIDGISRFRGGQRQFRFNARRKDEFGTLADSFDDMADSIVDSVKNPLSITGMDRRIIYMNEQGLAMNNSTLDKVIGLSYSEVSFYPVEAPYNPISALEEGVETAVFYAQEMGRYLRGLASYLTSKEGVKLGYIIETTDVTEMVLKQLELESAMNAANLANEHKGEFLARMSHEIRTPMNAIIGLTNILLRNLEEGGPRDLDRGEIRDHLSQIEASSQHLLCLLNDILDISKIEAGKIYITEEKADLIKLIGTVASIIRPRCEEKEIIFKTYLDDFSPSSFLIDSLRLRQVLINLLGNAVKFTPEGGRIEMRVENKGRRAGETQVKFTVADTGIGISEEDQADIFKPFEQGGANITRLYGGTGLGLTISRHIVQLIGGDIEVQSKIGEGSAFSFTVWFKETEMEEAREETPADPANIFAGQRALLVDDVALNRKVARAMLKVTGMTVDEADDGQAAVKKFEESPVNTYDVILMDVLMPNMDGYEASRIIRGLNRPDAATVPIIALTANAFQDDIDKALEAGMNAHLAKPVKIDKLVAAILLHRR